MSHCARVFMGWVKSPQTLDIARSKGMAVSHKETLLSMNFHVLWTQRSSILKMYIYANRKRNTFFIFFFFFLSCLLNIFDSDEVDVSLGDR